MTWSFFESGHGKGEHDGAGKRMGLMTNLPNLVKFALYLMYLVFLGACVKSALRRYQLKPDAELLDNAQKVVQWCTSNMTLSASSTSSWPSRQEISKGIFRFFWEISSVDRSRQFTCRTVQGTQKLHSVSTFSSSPPTIRIRGLACYCEYCMVGLFHDCTSKLYVLPWQLVTLYPDIEDENQIEVSHVEPQFMVDYDDLTDIMEIGDVFAVIAGEDNDEGVDYYLLQCNSIKSKLVDSIVDDYGIDYSRGDMVVKGTYFVYVPSRAKRYLAYERFNVEKTSIQFSHLVIGTKLRMTTTMYKGKERFQLLISDHERLLDVIRSRT